MCPTYLQNSLQASPIETLLPNALKDFIGWRQILRSLKVRFTVLTHFINGNRLHFIELGTSSFEF